MSSFGSSPYGSGAGKVDSGVSQLVIKDENGNPKNVSNLTTYMDIFIPAENGAAESSYHLITKGDMLVLKLNVTNNMSAIYVWAIPAYNNTMTKVLCKKGSQPTQTDFHFSDVLPKDPVEPGNGSCNDALSDSDRYQLFIGSDELEMMNQTASGLWYCGFYYNGSTQETTARGKRQKTPDQESHGDAEEIPPEKNNVAITIFEATCKYYHTKSREWRYDGCKVKDIFATTSLFLYQSRAPYPSSAGELTYMHMLMEGLLSQKISDQIQ